MSVGVNRAIRLQRGDRDDRLCLGVWPQEELVHVGALMLKLDRERLVLLILGALWPCLSQRRLELLPCWDWVMQGLGSFVVVLFRSLQKVLTDL